MNNKRIVATVWTGIKSLKIKGELIEVPRVSVYDNSVIQQRIHPEYRTRTFVTLILFRSNKPVKSICRSGHEYVKWWLYYTPDRLTGGFTLKKDAIAWRHNGGK